MQDSNYNVLGIVDGTGKLVERYEYTPYGQRTVFYAPGSNDELAVASTSLSRRVRVSGTKQPYGINEIGHQGLMLEDGSGLVYNRARFLQVRLGRFMQRDPMNLNQPNGGYQDGTNLYEYLQMKPINGVDPSGLASIVKKGTACAKAVAEYKRLGEEADMRCRIAADWTEKLTKCVTSKIASGECCPKTADIHKDAAELCCPALKRVADLWNSECAKYSIAYAKAAAKVVVKCGRLIPK